MVYQETRTFQAPAMAQNPSGHRCGHAGDQGDRSDRQPGRRCRAGKRHRFERTGEGCCPNCWTRFSQTNPLARSLRTARMTRGAATPPSRRGTPAPSYLRARTRGHGWRTHPARRPGTTPPAPPAASAARSGGAGAGITGEAWSRYEPGQKTIRGIVFPAIGCDASSCSVSASLSWFEGKPLPGNAWRATLTGRSPNCKSGRQS